MQRIIFKELPWRQCTKVTRLSDWDIGVRVLHSVSHAMLTRHNRYQRTAQESIRESRDFDFLRTASSPSSRGISSRVSSLSHKHFLLSLSSILFSSPSGQRQRLYRKQNIKSKQDQKSRTANEPPCLWDNPCRTSFCQRQRFFPLPKTPGTSLGPIPPGRERTAKAKAGVIRVCSAADLSSDDLLSGGKQESRAEQQLKRT